MLARLLPILIAIATADVLAAGPPEKSFDLTIARGAVPTEQRVLRVDKGDAVRIRLTSDAPGDVHLHGYRLEAKLTPGSAAELAFEAYAMGRYRIEWHGAGATGGSTGGHHSAPLASLEVRPK
jgi:FtsP/CotA-like multicopper oxidase with cupredoxin domain